MPKRKSSRKESLDATQLLTQELQEIHSAEKQLSGVLPRLSKAVESEALRKMLDQRLSEGERLLEEVDSVLQELNGGPGRKKNVAAEGLIKDAREHVQEIEAGPALDAALIGAVQKTEHYCIAAWGTARSLAQAVGRKDAVRAMERALKEGKSLDEQLTELAEQEVTPSLLELSEEEDEDSQEAEETEGRSSKGRSSSNGRRRRKATH